MSSSRGRLRRARRPAAPLHAYPPQPAQPRPPSRPPFGRPRPAAVPEPGESTLKSDGSIFRQFRSSPPAALEPKIGRRSPGARNLPEKYVLGLKLDHKIAQSAFSTVSADAPDAPIRLDRKMLQQPSSTSAATRLAGRRCHPPRIDPKLFSRRFATALQQVAQRVATRGPSHPPRGPSRASPRTLAQRAPARRSAIGRTAGRAACRGCASRHSSQTTILCRSPPATPLTRAAERVGGHEILPSGGHVAARWRPTVLPSGGQQNCPR